MEGEIDKPGIVLLRFLPISECYSPLTTGDPIKDFLSQHQKVFVCIRPVVKNTLQSVTGDFRRFTWNLMLVSDSPSLGSEKKMWNLNRFKMREERKHCFVAGLFTACRKCYKECGLENARHHPQDSLSSLQVHRLKTWTSEGNRRPLRVRRHRFNDMPVAGRGAFPPGLPWSSCRGVRNAKIKQLRATPHTRTRLDQ